MLFQKYERKMATINLKQRSFKDFTRKINVVTGVPSHVTHQIPSVAKSFITLCTRKFSFIWETWCSTTTPGGKGGGNPAITSKIYITNLL